MKIRILVIVSMCISTGVFAGGYRVALQGQQATGMGHTGVAVTESAEVIFFNPAGMSSLNADTNLSAGVSLIDSTIKYQNTLANTSAETINPIGTPLNLYYTKKLNQNISYGLGIYTPYGNSVKWPKDWPGSYLVNNISLRTIFIQPTISYKVNEKISFGFGPTYVNGSVNLNRNLSSSPSVADANGERANVTIEANNITAWGYNAGFLFTPVNPLSIGINYRSRVDMKARDGAATFKNLPSSMEAAYTDTKFDADLVLPAELTLGISYNLNPSTILAIDVNRTFWSAYKSLDLTFKNGLDPSLGPRNYNDANTYRIGLQHKLTRAFTVRTGAYYDDSPISAGYYTPETPRNDSIGLTAGVSYAVTEKLAIDASFLYMIFKEFNGVYDYVGYDNDPSTPNASFGGDYISSVTALGFGLNYQF